MKSNEGFTQRAENAIENARAEAAALGNSFVGSEHLLLGILAEPSGAAFPIRRRCCCSPARPERATRCSATQRAASLPCAGFERQKSFWRPA